MKSIEEVLKHNRPNLSSSSIKTYISTLKNIYKRVYPDDKEIEISKFYNSDDFLQILKDVEFNKRKSILSSLVVICPSDKNEKYKELMLQDATKYNNEQLENKKTPTQEANWINQNEVEQIYSNYATMANKLFKLKDSLTMAQIQTIQNFIIICLTAGIFIPPRRSLDWTLMKWKDYKNDSDNYYNKKLFCFNQYKTAKFYHQQDIDVPPQLKAILNKWIKVIDSDYLLFDSNNNPLSPVKLNQRLNKIFNGKISVNALRHSFITEKYTKQPMTLKEMKDNADMMGHSLLQSLEYVKY
jgi:hypothetical protein